MEKELLSLNTPEKAGILVLGILGFPITGGVVAFFVAALIVVFNFMFGGESGLVDWKMFITILRISLIISWILGMIGSITIVIAASIRSARK